MDYLDGWSISQSTAWKRNQPGNCRGAGNDNFLRNLRDLKFIHRPAIIAILEPRVSGAVADRQCKLMGMKRWYRVEANGFSRGIWILWEAECRGDDCS